MKSNFNFQEESQKTQAPVHLDAAKLGDFPARYMIPAIKSHEFPAVGVYVDPRIVPGFRYRVRPIQDQVNLLETCISTKKLVNPFTATFCKHWLPFSLQILISAFHMLHEYVTSDYLDFNRKSSLPFQSMLF
jgi:hypothetical protein